MIIRPTVEQSEVKKPEEAGLTRREAFLAGAAGGVAVTEVIPHALNISAELIRSLFRQHETKVKPFPVLSVPSTLTKTDMLETLDWFEKNGERSLFKKFGLEKPTAASPIFSKHNISLDLEDIKELFEKRNDNSDLLALWTLIRLRAEHNKEHNRQLSMTVFNECKLTRLLSYLRPDCGIKEIRDVVYDRQARLQLAKDLDEN